LRAYCPNRRGLIGWGERTREPHIAEGIPAGGRARPTVSDLDNTPSSCARAIINPPFLFASLMMRIALPYEYHVYCLDCHYAWPLAVPVMRPLDRLGWPYDSRPWHPENSRPAKPRFRPTPPERASVVVRAAPLRWAVEMPAGF